MLSHLLCFGRHTITALLRSQDRTQQDWSADYRFYAEDRFEEDKLFAKVRSEVEKLSKPEEPLVVAMDDSLLRKCGRKIHGSRYQRDPLSPPFHTNLVRGLRVLQISAAVPQGSQGAARMIPVDFCHAPLPAKPRRDAPEEQQALYRAERAKSNLNVVGQNRLQHLRAQMDSSGSVHRGLVVAVDGRFTNSTLLRGLPERTVLIGRVRKDGLFFHAPLAQPERGRKKKYGERCPTPEQLLKDSNVAWQLVQGFAAGQRWDFRLKTLCGLYTPLDKGQQPWRLIVIEPVAYRPSKSSKLQRRQPAFLICNDSKMSLEQILQMFLWRWDIEVNFRDEKTVLGVGQAQVRSESSNQNAPALGVAAYALLLLASIKSQAREERPQMLKSPRWYPKDPGKRATTNNLLNQLRYEMWANALNRNHFMPFSQSTAPNHNALKCDHPLASAVFLSIR